MPKIAQVFNVYDLVVGTSIAGYELTSRSGSESSVILDAPPYKEYHYHGVLHFSPLDDKSQNADALNARVKKMLHGSRQVNHRGHWYAVHVSQPKIDTKSQNQHDVIIRFNAVAKRILKNADGSDHHATTQKSTKKHPSKYFVHELSKDDHADE